MIKAVFFDFDGVLTTDHRPSITIANNIHEIEPEYSTSKIIDCYRKVYDGGLYTGSYTHADRWNEFCEALAKNMSIDTMNEILKKVPVNTAIVDIAKRLAKKYAVGIITDNDNERVNLILDDLHLHDVFKHVIVSANERCSKHDGTTDIFDAALSRTKCIPTESIFIDNKEKNLEVAKIMGFYTYWHDDSINDVSKLERQLKEWDCQI